jgi:hypothetical protein
MPKSGLVTFAVIEDLDVVEDDRAHLRARLVLDGSVQKLNLSHARKFCESTIGRYPKHPRADVVRQMV